MRTSLAAALVASLFVAGIGLATAAPRPHAEPSLYHGKDARDAGRALLEIALQQAGKGSWERIGVGRVYYLGGDKAAGQAIFDAILADKPDDSDVFRIARVYREAGEWDKARPLFERYLAANPRDDKALAEVGSDYLMQGDRVRGEQLLDKSFQIEPDEVWSTISAAQGYFNVTPGP